MFYNKIILDILTKRFIEIENIDPKIARAAATIAISIALAVGTFAPMLEMTGVSEIQPVRDLSVAIKHDSGLSTRDEIL